jgi:hypothetical protein
LNFVRGLLDRIVLVIGIIAGGCVPSFIAQYQQRLGGRLEQVERDLAPFQEIANRSHGGSLQALVQYHLQSTDPTFHDEGRALQAMLDAVAYLKDALRALNTDLFHQAAYLAVHYDRQTMAQTWGAFQPSFPVSPESAVFAVLFGLTVWIVFVVVWAVIQGGPRAPRADPLPRRHSLNVDLDRGRPPSDARRR